MLERIGIDGSVELLERELCNRAIVRLERHDSRQCSWPLTISMNSPSHDAQCGTPLLYTPVIQSVPEDPAVDIKG